MGASSIKTVLAGAEVGIPTMHKPMDPLRKELPSRLLSKALHHRGLGNQRTGFI
jgi:hypothetical protein